MKTQKQFLTTVGLGLAGVATATGRFSTKSIDAPRLEFAFGAIVTLGLVQELGNTLHGRRRIIPITGGTFEGLSIKGTIESGGGDWQIVRGDNVAELEAHYTLKTDDDVFIYIRNKGYRHGPTEVLQRIAKGEEVNPKEYYFRTAASFETASPKYDYRHR